MKKAILIGLLAIFGAGLILANVSYTGNYEVRPSRRGWLEPPYVPADAAADGTANTCFTFLIELQTGSGEIFWQWPTLIVNGRRYPMWLISGNWEQGVWCATAYPWLPSWVSYDPTDPHNTLPFGASLTGGPQSFEWYVIASSASPTSTTPPDIVESEHRQIVVTGVNRVLLFPEGGAYGQGLTIDPLDPGHPDAGSSSCTYTFRVKYIHLDGLPPRFFVNTDAANWYGGGYSSGQDNWRDEGGDYNAKIQTLSINRLGTPVVWIKDRSNSEISARSDDSDPVTGQATGVWIPHFMVVESPNKDIDQLTGQDYMNGVIYKYTVRPTEYLGYYIGQGREWNLWPVLYNGGSQYVVNTVGNTSYIVYPQRILRGMSGDGITFSNHYVAFGNLGKTGYREPNGHSNPGYPTTRSDTGFGAGQGAGWDFTFSQSEINYYFEASADLRPYNMDRDGDITYYWWHQVDPDTGQAWGSSTPVDFVGNDRYDYTRFYPESSTSCNYILYPFFPAFTNAQVPEQVPGWKPFRLWNYPILSQGGFTYGYTGWKYGSEKYKDHDPLEPITDSPLVQITTNPLEVWVPEKIAADAPDGKLLLSVNNGNSYVEYSPIPRPAPYKWRRVPSSSKIRFWVKYTQPKNKDPYRVRVLIYDYQKGMWMEYWMLRYEGAPNDGDYRNGEWYYFETTLPPGKYATFFDANDYARTAKFPARPKDDPSDPVTSNPNKALYWVRDIPPNPPDLDVNPDPWDNPVGSDFLPGPWVNNDPVLWGESLSPTSGPSGTTFTWTVSYKDADNDPPRFALLVINKIDKSTGQILETRRCQMARVSWLGSANDWTAGATFQYQSKYFNPETQEPFDPRCSYSYHFEFTDDWGEPYYPETGTTIRYPASYDISGPEITTNRVPYLADPNLTSATGGVPSPQIPVTWRVTYYDGDDDAPAWIKMFIMKTDDTGANWTVFDTIKMTQEDPSDTLYRDGTVFWYTAKLVYGPQTYYAAEFTTNDGKTDDRPVEAIEHTFGAVDPANGTVANSWVIHLDKVDPALLGQNPSVELLIERKVNTDWEAVAILSMQDEGGGQFAVRNYPLLAFDPNDPTSYSNSYRYTFHITYNGGELYLPKDAEPAKRGFPFLLGPRIIPNIPPKLLSPKQNPDESQDDSRVTEYISPVDPSSGLSIGGLNDTFTYTVQFVDGNNQMPSYVKLVIDLKKAIDMQPVDPDDDRTDDGKLYKAEIKGSDLGAGLHSFHLEASDGTDSVRYPTSGANYNITLPTGKEYKLIANGEVQLPYINDKPALSDIAVSSSVGVPNIAMTFFATYSDANNDAPKYVKATIEKKQPDGSWAAYRTETMSQVDPAATDYKSGVEYKVDPVFTETGEYRFFVEADDGREFNNYVKAPLKEEDYPQFRIGSLMTITPKELDLGADPKGVVTIQISTRPGQSGHITVTNPEGVKIADKDFQADTTGSYSEQVSPDTLGQYSVEVNTKDSKGNVLETLQATFLVKITRQFPAVDMVALPFEYKDTAVKDIFGNQLSNLTLKWWNPAQGKYVDLTTLNTGQGFWMKVAGLTAVELYQGTKYTEPSFTYTIQKGWNIIGSPYTSDLDLSALTVMYGTQQLSLSEADREGLVRGYLWGYDTTTGDYILIHPALSGDNRTIKGWKGYWIKAMQDGVQLVFTPARKSVEARDLKPEGWKVQLVAQSSTGKDTCNYLGMGDSGLLSGVEEPPALSGVQLYFLRKGERLAWDVREKAERAEWDVVVEGAGEITLSWPNLSQLPKGYALYLIDGDKRINMLTSSRYVFSSDGRKELKVVYERRASALLISGLMAKATRGGVNVSFSLSDSADVKVSVKGVDGRLIKEMTRSGVAGLNSVVWDGKDAQGKPLPAGVYLLEVIARSSDGSFVRGITMFNLR
ncbi:hypothetical protein H5T88_06965 [bacterium]|nr:hypothetical protein [bacterium]